MTETCIYSLYNESAKQINGRRNVSAFIHNTVFSIYSYNYYTALNAFLRYAAEKRRKNDCITLRKIRNRR